MGVQYIHKDVQLMQNQITSIDYVQGTDVIPIKITVLDYIIPTGCEIRVYIHKPSGAIIYNMASISGQTVTITPTTQMFAESGQSKGNVEFIHNGKKIATFPIMFNIYPNYRDEGALESKDEYEALIHYMLLAQSYAIGGSGIRSGENTDNSKYYMTQSKSWAQGGTNARTGEATNNSKYWSTLGRSYAVGDTNSRSGETTDNSKYYMTQAKSWTQGGTNARTGEATNNAKYWAGESKTSATNSANSATASANSATASANSAAASKTSANESSKWKTESKSWAVGGTNVRKNENTDNAKYYANYAKEQAELARERALSSIKPKGTIAFADIPTTGNTTGDMYNISNAFTTDARFKEGAGRLYPQGSNIYWTTDGKWDVFAGLQVTGVKGNSETSYRNGNVNITKANIGLGNVDNTKDADKHVAYAESAGDGVKSVTASGMNMVLEKNNGTKITFTAEAGDVGQLSRNTHTNLINSHHISGQYITNGVTYDRHLDGRIVAKGTVSSTGYSNYWLRDYNHPLHLKAGTYRLTGCPAGGSMTTWRLSVKHIGKEGAGIASDLGEGKTFKLTEDTDVAIYIQVTGADRTVTDLAFKPMLSTDESANYDDYVGYSGNGPINENVANLYPVALHTLTNLIVPRQQTQTVRDVTCTDLGNGTYKMNGTPTANANFFPLLIGQGITPKSGVLYRLTGCPAGGSLSTYALIAEAELGTAYVKYYAYDIGNGATFEVPQEDIDAGYTIRITMSIRAAVTNKIFKPMLSHEPTANYSDFVPYSGDGNLNQNVASLYEAFSTFFDIVHPVGDLVITRNASFNPNTAAGWKGTWERDKGRFVRLAGDNDVIGSTGGADERTLELNNLPQHRHVMEHYHLLNNHTHTIPQLSGSTGNHNGHFHNVFKNASSGNAIGTYTYAYIQGTREGDNAYIIAGGSREPDYCASNLAGQHSHTVTTNASTTGSNNDKTSSSSSINTGYAGSDTAFDNRPFHENFYGWVRVS